MGRRHLRVLRDLPGVELAGAADPSPAAQAAAPDVPVVPDVGDLLRLGIDLCVVAAPTLAHTDIGLRLAAAGVPALIEKPLAADFESGLLLTAAFEARGLVGCAGHIERYNPALTAMRDLVSHGEVGQPFQLATRRQGPFPDRIRDVGVVMDLAAHDIDLTCWVTGSSYRTVTAVTGRPGGRVHEDLAVISGTLRNGTIAAHLINWLSPVKERVVTLTGTHGALVADTLTGQLWLHRTLATTVPAPGGAAFPAAPAGATTCTVRNHEPLQAELESFRDAVLGRPANVVSLRQGLAAVAVAEAVLAASSTGSAVEPATVEIGQHQGHGLAARSAAGTYGER